MNIWKRLADWVDGEDRSRWSSESPRPDPARAKVSAPHQRHKLTKKEKDRIFRILYRICGTAVSLGLLAVLLLAVLEMPLFGDPSNPTNNELVKRYIEKGLQEGGATNLVANMILSYRVFDTFGESNVLFLAATSVTMLLLRDGKNTTRDQLRAFAREDIAETIVNDRILRSVTRILLPLIILFSVYVMFNGHLSPGGGFAGGSLLGGGLILYAQEFGTGGVRKFLSRALYQGIRVTALSGYGLILLYYAFTGANGLDNHIWLGIPGTLISAGVILPINVMVGFVVTCTVYAFYALFHKGEI